MGSFTVSCVDLVGVGSGSSPGSPSRNPREAFPGWPVKKGMGWGAKVDTDVYCKTPESRCYSWKSLDKRSHGICGPLTA